MAMRKLKLQVQMTVDGYLIDELNIFVNPVAIGSGMRIFKHRKPLRVVSSTAYSSGVVVNTYQPAR